MNINLFLSQNEDLKLVKVTFAGSTKKYTYKTLLSVEEGDKVVVDSPRDGMVMVDVTEVTPAIESDLNFSYNLKWIVQVVDTTHYEECAEMESKLNKELNKIKAQKARKELLAEAKESLGTKAVNDLVKLVRL